MDVAGSTNALAYWVLITAAKKFYSLAIIHQFEKVIQSIYCESSCYSDIVKDFRFRWTDERSNVSRAIARRASHTSCQVFCLSNCDIELSATSSLNSNSKNQKFEIYFEIFEINEAEIVHQQNGQNWVKLQLSLPTEMK